MGSLSCGDLQRTPQPYELPNGRLLSLREIVHVTLHQSGNYVDYTQAFGCFDPFSSYIIGSTPSLGCRIHLATGSSLNFGENKRFIAGRSCQDAHQVPNSDLDARLGTKIHDLSLVPPHDMLNGAVSGMYRTSIPFNCSHSSDWRL